MSMDLTMWVVEYGLWGLAGSAFAAATLLPFSSEIAVVAALGLGLPPEGVLLSASAGNALGATLNYVFGLAFAGRVRRSLEKRAGGRRALQWTQRYGKWSLAASWLPIVGDPLCLTAGIFRINFLFFTGLGIGTRIARYGLLVYFFVAS